MGSPETSDALYSTMMFHEKIDIKLIRLVRQHPVLYDHNNIKYMDFNAREVAWQKIGDEIKRSAADCKVRWINIRDVYRRILKKNSRPSGHQLKPYKYESEVSFLRQYFKDISCKYPNQDETDEQCSYQVDENEDDGAVYLEDSDDSDEVLQKPLKKKSNKTSAKKKKKKRKFEEPVDPMNTVSFNESATPSDFDSSDPVDAFLLSIGATLKTFSAYHLNVAKSKIFSVVQEHELQQIVEKQQSNDVTPHDVKISTSERMYNGE